MWSKLERGGSFGTFSGAYYRNKKRQDNQRILAEDVDNYSHVTVVEDADPQILDNDNTLEQSKESSIPQLHHGKGHLFENMKRSIQILDSIHFWLGEEKAAKDVDDEIVEVDPADTSMEDASDRVCMLKNYVHLLLIEQVHIWFVWNDKSIKSRRGGYNILTYYFYTYVPQSTPLLL